MVKAVASDKSMANDTTPPGEGPTREERENGFYGILFVGHTAGDEEIRASVKGDMDPGYGSTSKMISEAAITPLETRGTAPDGILMPAAAMGTTFISHLQKNAGLTPLS